MSPLDWARQVDIPGNVSHLENGSDQQVLAKHELRVDVAGGLVFREVQHERPGEGSAVATGLLHQVKFVISKSNVHLHEFLEEKDGVAVVVDLPLGFGNVRRVRPLNWIRERVHFNPPLQGLLVARVLKERDSKLFLKDRSVASDVRVADRGSRHATVHQANERAVKTVEAVQRRQLITHPVKTRVLGASSRAGPHEVHNLVSTLDLIECFFDYSGPVLGVLVVILHWVRAVEELDVEWQVLAKVVHPAGASTFLHQVFLDDRLGPVPSVRVGEVNHSELNTKAMDESHITVLIFDEVPVLFTNCELILSDSLDLACVLDVGVDVDEGSDPVYSPLVNHVVPVVVPVLF